MRRRTTAALAASTVLGAGAAVGAVVAGRWAGDTALSVARPQRPAGFGRATLVVHATTDDRITLTRTLDSVRPGTYGIIARACHAVVGPVLDVPVAPHSVVRRLERVNRGELIPGTTVELTPQLHRGDPTALGIAHTDVSIPAEQGTLPAWFVEGDRDTWIIALHGLGATREHPLNLLPFLHDHRFPVLVPGYRGDPGAPRPADRVSRLGAAEWHDADAALRHAVGRGAERVVLYGWSAGAAMALRAARHSPDRDRLCGLVLDSPVLDPEATLRALAADRGVPRPLLPLAVRAARGGFGLDPGDRPPENPLASRGTPLPVLVLHGPADTIAPWDASRALAARHPEAVTLHSVPDAQHAALWNADPAAYEERLRHFLTPLM
ncbi:alpha/beta hydrolase [Streptomyces sp. SBT349]|uniref:alpha/beta hydrolase n=1 Tax=Streptomyces sp. SBT349 TaxID=1580539 RepID=UPI00066AB66F|nr:alpha/beta hydrolase [Streptomyces sp. SBT349]